MTSEPTMSAMMKELSLALRVEDNSTHTLTRISLLFDTLHEQIVVTNPQGVIVYINRATELSTGFASGEVLGHTPELWRLEKKALDESAFWENLVKERKQYHSTVRNVHKDGRVYEADLQILPMIEDDGNISFFFCIERDTSETSELERIQRRVIALTSHKLKTPLTAMRWQAEILRDGEMGPISKPQQESINDILAGIVRMVGIIEQWQTVTDLDLGLYTPHTETVEIENVVQDVLNELQERIEKEGVSIRFTPNPSLTSIAIDALCIRTIVHTLIFNAVKYNRQNGTVEIHVETLPAQTEYEGKKFSEERVILSVRDTGLGIPKVDQNNVFQQCFHGSNIETMQAEGAGLGLYIARKLVHTASGDIWFTTSEEGSRFVVALPNNNSIA
jgi:PAS domain S-box-containing protein